MAYFEVRNISKSFNEYKAVDDVSFMLEKGEILSIIGPSGVGKTTLLRCLNLLEYPDKGEYILNGEKIFEATEEMPENEIRSIRKHFGLVFQNFNLFPQYTVKENVTLAAKLNNIDPDYRNKADELLKKLGLEDKADAYPYTLSGGQQQRVAIARALELNPEVICFDEPTSALDPELADNICKLIRSLKKEVSAIIVVTHDMNFAKKVSDRIICLKDGKVDRFDTVENYFS
ncbi:MAG: amino acid ABC transporter ATP-binding protein [Erysipelotrichaceae bacterium]|nr:amino acid ABC transporter ATP-binding protein [Erysipelotrichaceae bacterium]